MIPDDHDNPGMPDKMPIGWQAAEIVSRDGTTYLRKLDLEELVDFAYQPGWRHYVSCRDWPGCLVWANILEFDHFPPRTRAAELMKIHWIEWQGSDWFITSIPAQHHAHALAAADRTHMVLLEGVPMAKTDHGTAMFPIATPHVYTVTMGPILSLIARSPIAKQGLLKSELRVIDKRVAAYAATFATLTPKPPG